MPKSQDPQTQVAVITGGGTGIGAAIAHKMAQLGSRVVVCGRSQEPLEKTADEIRSAGGECKTVRCDVSHLGQVEAMAGQLKQEFGRVDVLVNNAGIGGFDKPLHSLPPDDWDKMLNTNLRGVYYCIRAFVPMMMAGGGGHIVNISSLAGKNPVPNGAAYAASKWGLNGLSYSAAEELRGHNIRVSIVCPGSTETDLSPHAGKARSKMLQPEDVAHVVGMLVTQAPQSFCSEVLIRPTQKP